MLTEDHPIVEEMRGILAPYVRDLGQLKATVRALAERSSRPPGQALDRTALAGPQLMLSRQLSDDGGFQNWLKSAKTQNSAFACELNLPPLTRKAGPIADISPVAHVPLIYAPPPFPLRLVTLLPTLTVTSGNVEFLEETSFVPNAAVVPETTLKPTTELTYAQKLSKVATIASVLKVSVQALADIGQLMIWLDTRLLYAVLLRQEAVLLLGDAANGIPGLLDVAPTFNYTPVASDNPMDIPARAIGDLMSRGYTPDGVVMNPADYTNLRLLKSTIGTYLFMGEAGAGPDDEDLWEPRLLLWQIPAVLSPSMPQGQFLVGAFRQSCMLFMREVANVQIAFQNEDDFIRNLVCLRGELRSGLAVALPQGLLKGTLPAATFSTPQSAATRPVAPAQPAPAAPAPAAPLKEPATAKR
jgi:hypothetical protein